MRVQPQSAWHDSRRQRKQFRFKSDIKWYGYMLGGGFKYFIFSPLVGEMIQFDEYFSDGLVQPPTSSWYFRNLTSNFWSFNPSCHGMLSKRPSWGSALEYCESFLAGPQNWLPQLTFFVKYWQNPMVFCWNAGYLCVCVCVCVPVTCQLPVLLSLLISRFKICFWRGYWIQLSGPEAGELEGF